LRRIIFPLVLGLMILAAAAWGIYWWTEARFLESTDNAYIEADIAVIAPRVAGYVTAVHVTDNQAVAAGAPLFSLDPRDASATVAAAEADYARALAATGTAAATTATEGSRITEAEAALRSATATRVQAEADLRRVGEVYRRGFATKQLYDAAIAAADGTRAAEAQARATILAQRSRRTAAASVRSGAGMEVAAAAAVLETARLGLGYTQVKAPVAGIVGNRSVRIGEYVRAGQQTMVIVPVADVYVIANFKETQVGAMRPGQLATIRLDAYPDSPIEGRVLSFAPASGSRFSILPPENATGNFTKIVQRVPVKIVLNRPIPEGVRLAPGLSVKATVDIRTGG